MAKRQVIRRARRNYTGKRFQALDSFLEEARLLGGIFVASAGKRDLRRQDVIRVNSEVSVNSVEKLLDENSCCDHKHQCQGDLRGHENTPGPLPGLPLPNPVPTSFDTYGSTNTRLT